MTTPGGNWQRKLGELAGVVIIFLGVAAIAFWQFATSFAEQGADSGSPFDNAAMFPRLIAWALIVLGAVQIAITFFAGRMGASDRLFDLQEGTGSEPTDPVAPEPTGSADGDGDSHLLLRALICVGVFVLYLAIVTTVGYLLATVIMLCAMFLVLGARPLLAAGVAVAATLGIGFVFNTLLNVVLPVGRLGLPTIF